MTLRSLLRAGFAAAALALVLAGPASAASFEPDPGDWSASPAKGKGARAVVEFTVDPDDGTVSPFVKVSVRRCGRGAKRWSSEPAAVAVDGGAFKVRNRSRAGRGARLDLRLRGTFDSPTSAHGTVAGRVKLRARGRRGRVACKLPKLSWTAELAVPYAEDEESDDEEPDPYDPEADEEYGPDEDEGYEDEEPDEGE